MKKARTGYLLVAPLCLGFLLFYVLPFGQVVWDSFSTGSGQSQTFAGLSQYEKMLHNEMFLLAFGNTLRFLAIALPLIMLLSYGLALFLKGQVERFSFLNTLLLLPYVMPVAGTVLLVDLLFSEMGLFNRLLLSLGLPMEQWLSSSHALWVMLLLYLWKSTGYSVILLLAGLTTLPPSQYAAAQLEGASRWQQFRYITTPQMWYAVFIAFVFSLINAFKCFREIFLVGGEHPHPDVYLLQHFIHNTFQNLSYQRLAVASVLLFLVIVVVVGLFYGFVMRKEAAR